MVLERINSPEDLKQCSMGDLNTLAEEMRNFLIERASKHMGHVGPDLGFVEATIALHRVFLPQRLILELLVRIRPIPRSCLQVKKRGLWKRRP